MTESVILFHSPSAARRAYHAMSGNALAVCEAAGIQQATPSGVTVTLRSRYREHVIAKGIHTPIYGWNAVVRQGGITARARFESIALLHGRSFAFMFFESDGLGRQAASQVALINLAATRLP